MTTHPIVLVSATTRLAEGVERVRLNRAYLMALEGAAMIPLVSPPVTDVGAAEAVLRSVDGLVLSGGEDVSPARFGAVAHDRTWPAHFARDAWEIALVEAAHRRAVPTLAICRGIQVVNVVFGGTLVQDIPSECPGALAHDGSGGRDERVHEVAVEPDSRLAALLGATSLRTNSSHHQAVSRVGDGLRVTARAPDGVIEGIEWVGDSWWMTAVQWHPEELIHSGENWDRDLFRGFAARCRERSGVPA